MSLVADLSLLPLESLDSNGLTRHIAARYQQGMPFSTISTRALVAMNTFARFDVNQDQVFKDMAARICNRMQCRGESQVVLFFGENGSGKSEFANSLARNILTLADNPLSKQLRNIQPVLEAFGCAKTTTSLSSSKMGTVIELQYDHEANLVGSTIIDFRPDRNRVTNVRSNERNYNVFYYLVNGLTSEESYHLQLQDAIDHSGHEAKRYAYLGHRSQVKIPEIDDKAKFRQLKSSLYTLGFTRAEVANIFQVLAAILHLGQIEFKTSATDSSVAATTAVEIVNLDVLELVASFLGVLPETLATCLVSKTVLINKDRVTVVLDKAGARANAQEVARTLYALLTSWIIGCINSRLSLTAENSGPEDISPTVQATISIVDMPGFNTNTVPSLDRLLHNSANELLYNYMLHVYFQQSEDVLAAEDVEIMKTEYFDNADTVKSLVQPRLGVLSVIDDYARRDKDDSRLLEALERRYANSSVVHTDRPNGTFTVNHYAGQVEYGVAGLLEESRQTITGDIISLFTSSSSSDFLQELFKKSAIVDDTIGRGNDRTVAVAHLSSEPRRQLSHIQNSGSMRRTRSQRYSVVNERRRQGTYRGPSSAAEEDKKLMAPGQFIMAIDKMIDSFEDRNPYFVFCIKPNDHRMMSSADVRCIRGQVTGMGISDVAKRTKYTDHTIFMPFSEYLPYVEAEPDLMLAASERDRALQIVEAQGWPARDIIAGATGVFLSENAWLHIVDPEMNFAAAAMKKFADGNDGARNYLYPDSDSKSIGGFNMFSYAQDPDFRNHLIHANDEDMIDVRDLTEPAHETSKRRNWLMIVWLYTWWVPSILLSKIGKMTHRGVRVAWREKFAINLIIWGMCIGCILFLIGFPYLVCPLQDVMSTGELAGYNQNDTPTKVYTAIRGVVFDITKFANSHYPIVVPADDILHYGGKDSTGLFPMQVSAVCGGVNGTMSSFVTMGNTNNYTDQNARYHDFRYYTNDSRPDWYLQQMEFFNKNYRKAYIGYTPKDIKKMVSDHKKVVASLDGFVYDVTDYVAGDISTRAQTGYQPPKVDINFMDGSLIAAFQDFAGQDITKHVRNLDIDDDVRQNMNRCLRNIFLIGKLDTRGSARCLFARYFLLAVTCFVVAIVVIKFFAALQFGSFEYPKELKKFVICQVPAYTEDEKSLRRAIDSIALTDYDDKHKLLVVVCDGMIVGAGNELPTPHIVLKILGCPDDVDPPALSFESLGEGDKQHNMAKVYSGLYEVGDHIVPYLVVVKVGKPSEAFRPGNRGKRDSQMILMRFLNRVHYNAEMNPLELELYNQMQNVIGVSPRYYEFLLQVDADTVVSELSLAQLVGKMVRDTKIQGVCGETALSNARHSIITMIQVYEYYISHNLAKAFESLFGSVTCLPGCFSLYRLYEDRDHSPVFISTPIIEGYSENNVRTLHSKNLLHLGEDRYLTTLMLKYNPQYTTKFLRHAEAWTVAPDSWSVFLSQRRRWINSTVHNFIELIPLSQMCGFFLFSMRFIVILDLFSTLIQPVTCAYLAYLIYLCVSRKDDIPITSIAMVAAIYGLQAIVFILRRRWEMIGWMFVYILALPVFSLALPLYAFWYMDDFSWGNTRMILGEKGEAVLVPDEGHSDINSIPRKRWAEHDTFEKEAGDDESLMMMDRSTSMNSRLIPHRSIVDDEYNAELDNQPTDADLTEAIREILATADLSKITKRSVRLQLENHFNCKLDLRREYISSVTEALLSGEI